MLQRIDCDNSTGLEMLARGMQRIHDKMANGGGKNVLCSDLNDAGSAASLQCQEPSEIKVMGENDIGARSVRFGDLCIPALMPIRGRTNERSEPVLLQKWNLQQAEIHVHEELHAAGREISISSTR